MHSLRTLISALFISFAMLSTPLAQAAEQTTVTILGTSDVHGRFVPWDYALDAPNNSGSLTQLYTAIRQIRNENPNCILVDAGDAVQDNSAELFKRAPQHPMLTAMNAMGYDAWTLGNHEFNFGLDVLDHIAGQFHGSVLAGNLYKNDGTRFKPAYAIVERGGVRIGLIGMTTPLIRQFEAGTHHLDGLDVRDPLVETKRAIAELSGKVDVMIGVMHMGEDNENGIAHSGVRDIAAACPELTAIVAGHMHKLIAGDTINGVLVSEPSRYGAALSRIDLTLERQDNGHWSVIDKQSAALTVTDAKQRVLYPSDPELESQLNSFHQTARADANQVIGQLAGGDLVPANEIHSIPSVQIRETPLSDLFNDVQRFYSCADVVAISIDNDNARLAAGPIRKKDIAYNYQYAGGETTVYELNGADLKAYMEWSAGYFNSSRPGDATISFDPTRRASKYSTHDIFGNILYTIDLAQPYGSRIVELRRLDGRPILPADPITLGMNAYRMDQLTAANGIFAGKTFRKRWSSKEAFGEEDGVIRAMTIRYIRDVKQGQLSATPLQRWRIVGIDDKQPARVALIELLNAGILELPAAANGRSNIASVNLRDPVTASEIAALCNKLSLSPDSYPANLTRGEFYTLINAARTK